MPNEQTTQNTPEVNERNVVDDIIDKIYDAKNILIALSSDPSVDDLAAAIGMSIFFDKMGKRATAIYSGATPNALEFLKPEENLVSSTDTLQDFVVAINKDKADHLRYKVDGNYVKVYITPYGTKIGEDDLEFSYGDYNVDLVIALDVANGIDLDDALREHGRIMHDATIVNISTNQPGKFGEIEWSEPSFSSISEMAAELSYAFGGDFPVEQDEATAYLTGIVAATDRFSNAQTTPSTMLVASKLMRSGADQQLIAKNITSETDNALFQNLMTEQDKENIGVTHAEVVDDTNEEELPPKTNPEEEATTYEPKVDDGLIDLKDIEDSFKEVEAEASAEETAGPAAEPVFEAKALPTNELPVVRPEDPRPMPEESLISGKPELTIVPPVELSSENLDSESSKYGDMMAEALTGDNNPAAAVAPIVSVDSEVPNVEMDYSAVETPVNATSDGILPPPPAPVVDLSAAPAIEAQPVAPVQVAPEPEFTSAPAPIPEMQPVASAPVEQQVAPVEQPVAPIDPVVQQPAQPAQPIAPAQPVAAPEPQPLGEQPIMQDQIYTAPANDPTAFRIPGM